MEDPGLKFTLGKPLKGWLRRQGGMMRGWQRRFFVLKEKCLFCLSREDDTRISHTYLLDDYQLKEVPINPDDPDKFTFELFSDKNNNETVTLCAATDAERKEWMKALCYHIYADRGGAIFGLPLEETMKFDHKESRTVPHIVEACVRHLGTYAMETEGIFRLAGRAGLLREIRQKFETGNRPALDDVDVHTVGSLLKAYLRELPESLVPPNFYQRAMNCALRYAEASSDEARTSEVTGLSKLLEELPHDNYNVLTYICQFLARLAANSEKTKMDSRNLSLVFGPNLIRHMDNSPELLMVTADLNQHLAYMFINHCEDIFKPRPSSKPVESEPAVDRPVLRKKNPVLADVATDDLLRLSKPLDCKDGSLLVPRPTALNDLVGLDLTSQRDDVFVRNQASPSTPPSPFVFVSDHFDRTGQNVSERGDGSTSSDASGGKGSTSSPSIEHRPVAPRRIKSRTLKGRRMAAAPPSPVSPDHRQLDSQDILKALASSSRTHVRHSMYVKSESSKVSSSETKSKKAEDGKAGNDSTEVQATNSPSPDTHLSRNKKLNGEAEDKNYSSSQSTGSGSELAKNAADSDIVGDSSTGTEKLNPSQNVLKAQVTVLKTELVHTKAKSDGLVSALKSQLTDMRSKYEARISTMEKQHRHQMMDLTAKLDAERNARAEAVERTVSLQAQLYKYKMQYGDLPNTP